MVQRRAQIRVTKHEARHQRPARHDSLSIHQQLRHFSQRGPYEHCGHSHPHGPMKHACKRALNLQMRRRARRHCIHGAAHGRLVERELDETRQVVDVNPRHPLLACAQHGAETQPHRQRETRQRAAIATQDEAEPQSHHSRADGFGSARGFFPLLTQLRLEDRLR